MKLFKSFAKDETGAVTVDWVVLAGAVVAVGVGVVSVVESGLGTAAGDLETALAGLDPSATGTNQADGS